MWRHAPEAQNSSAVDDILAVVPYIPKNLGILGYGIYINSSIVYPKLQNSPIHTGVSARTEACRVDSAPGQHKACQVAMQAPLDISLRIARVCMKRVIYYKQTMKIP